MGQFSKAHMGQAQEKWQGFLWESSMSVYEPLTSVNKDWQCGFPLPDVTAGCSSIGIRYQEQLTPPYVLNIINSSRSQQRSENPPDLRFTVCVSALSSFLRCPSQISRTPSHMEWCLWWIKLWLLLTFLLCPSPLQADYMSLPYTSAVTICVFPL